MELHTVFQAKELPDPVFVDAKAAEKYKCGICLSILDEPADIGCSNQHLFCYNCLEQMEDNAYHDDDGIRCPTCRETIDKIEYTPSPFVNRLISQIEIKCCNYQLTRKRSNIKRWQSQRISRYAIRRVPRNRKDNKNRNEKSLVRSYAFKFITRDRSRERERNSEKHERKNNNNKEKSDDVICNWKGNFDDYKNHYKICGCNIEKCIWCHIEFKAKKNGS